MDSEPADILYVDDEINNLEVFKATFRRDFKIETALSAELALQYLDKNPIPPVILSDQRMPRMNGSEFLKIISEKYPDSIRMLITAYADLDATIQAINQGKIYHYIEKPFNPEDVKILLQKAFEVRDARKILKY